MLKFGKYSLARVALVVLVLSLGLGTMSAHASETARTLEEVRALNAAVNAHYGPMHEDWVPHMGIHWGVPGPSVVLAVASGNVVVAYEIIVPEAAGWRPWFDQPEGAPMQHEALGNVYTQHIYLADPATVNPGQTPALYELTWDNLVAANPGLQHYEQLSPFEPHMGFHYGANPAPSLVVLVGRAGEIFGFEILSPAQAGWFPWFDQAEGEPMTFPFGVFYTQHVYIVDPAAIH